MVKEWLMKSLRAGSSRFAGAGSVFALTTTLLLFNAVRAFRFAESTEPWTVGT